MHLIVLEDHRTPLVSFQMIIDGAGGYYDPPTLPGLAGFTATLMREGTDDEDVGADLRAARSAGGDASASAPGCRRRSPRSPAAVSTNNLDTVLALMADVLLHPSFPQEEIDRYKTRTRAGLMQPAHAAGIPRAGALQPGGVRQSPRRARVADARRRSTR